MSLQCNMKFYLLVVISSVLSITAAAPLLEQEVENEGEFGEYFEGDMVLTKEQEDAIDRIMDMDPATRNGLIDGAKRWPNRTVVYDIDDDNFDPDQLAMIEAGLMDIASKSCLRFRKRVHDEEHAVMIQGSQNGCFSHVGYNPSLNEEGDTEQVLNLDKGCFKLGNIVHQVLHTLGFHHMQSSLDRDNYVTILWENVVPGAEENFARYNNDSVNHGIPYDYDSVMHYPESVFSKNRKQTIVPKQGSGNGCYSNVGFNPGENEDGDPNQVLNLAKGCFKHGTVVHEMLHTLGFYHMQSTYDRDDFVTIVWENIKPGTEHNFAKYNNDTVTDYGVVYDYGSVMHYPEKAFSKNGNRTIIPTQENVTIGQRNGLSESDILKLHRMYCEESNEEEVPPPTNGSNDKVIIVDK